jgi:hypothetical protein
VPISPSLALIPGGPVASGPRPSFASPVAGLLLCLALGWGCAKQAEGERCDLNNGDLDCDTGLVCRGEANLSIKGRGIALCCPAVGDTKVDACRATAELPDEMIPPVVPAPVPEAGTPQPDATPAP